MYKSIYFWIITGLFLLIIGFTGLKVIPPVLSKLSESRNKINELSQQVNEEEKFIAALNAIKRDEAKLGEAYAKASAALPSTADSEQLMVQLDGLLSSLGLSRALIDVPLGATKPAAGAAAQTDQTASGSEVAVKISGNFDYTKTKDLLNSLKTFIRWNKVKDFTIANSGDTYNVTVTTRAFFKPGETSDFTGNISVIEKSESLFSDLRSYATKPDATQEGNYGKTNPFSQ